MGRAIRAIPIPMLSVIPTTQQIQPIQIIQEIRIRIIMEIWGLDIFQMLTKMRQRITPIQILDNVSKLKKLLTLKCDSSDIWYIYFRSNTGDIWNHDTKNNLYATK